MSLFKISAVITLAAVSIGVTGACSTGANTNANATTSINAANTNTNTASVVPASNTSAAAETTTAFDASTPTAAYVTAYNARKNKDVPTLKKLMSQDILEFFEIVAESETEGGKKKSVDDVLMELCEKPLPPKPDTRNEKIKGDRATLEYLDEEGEWSTMDFDKVDGMWKLGAPKAEDGPAGGMKSDDKGGKKK